MLDPFLRGTVPMGSALFAALAMKRWRRLAEQSDPERGEEPDSLDGLYPFPSESTFSGY